MNLQVSEEEAPRLQFAIERLLEGHPFDFYGVTIGWSTARSQPALEVLARSSRAIGEISAESARADLERGREAINYLASISSELAKLVRTHPQRYLLINDYGTGSVEVCRLVDGKLVWSKGYDHLS